MKFLAGQQDDDSWAPMLKAFQHVESGARGSLYATTFFGQERPKFQYPPTSLLILSSLHLTPVKHLLDIVGMSPVNAGKAISWVLMFVMGFFVINIFLLTSNTYGGERRSVDSGSLNRMVQMTALGYLMFTFYPLMRGFALGQIQTWISCATAAMLWCWIRDKKAAAGVLAGVICLIKPQYGVLLIWGALRKEWTFLKTWLSTLLAGLSISLLAFGLADHLGYLGVLSFLAQRGEAFYPNQSVNGALNRLFFNGSNLVFFKPFPEFHPWVYAGTVVSSLLIVGTALALPALGGRRGSPMDFCIMLLSATMASPIAWEHHYGVLLPIYAFIIPYLVYVKAAGKWTIVWLCTSFVLVSSYFEGAKALANTPWNILQSYLLVGAFLLLVGMHVMSPREAPARSTASG